MVSPFFSSLFFALETMDCLSDALVSHAFVDLMLDMSGYKIDDDDVEQSAHATQHILEDEVGISSGIHESMDDRKSSRSFLLIGHYLPS